MSQLRLSPEAIVQLMIVTSDSYVTTNTFFICVNLGLRWVDTWNTSTRSESLETNQSSAVIGSKNYENVVSLSSNIIIRTQFLCSSSCNSLLLPIKSKNYSAYNKIIPNLLFNLPLEALKSWKMLCVVVSAATYWNIIRTWDKKFKMITNRPCVNNDNKQQILRTNSNHFYMSKMMIRIWGNNLVSKRKNNKICYTNLKKNW